MINKHSASGVPFLTEEMIEAQALMDIGSFVRKTERALSFPIYPDELLKALWDIEVEYPELVTDSKGKPVLAYFLPSERVVRISTAIRGNEGRVSFTTAHETGHVSLHDFLTSSGACAGGTTIVEWQADQYASALLMPRDSLREVLTERGCGNSVDLVAHGDYLCKKFGVSRHALEIRLAKIGITMSGRRYSQKMAKLPKDSVYEELDHERQSWVFQE